VSEASPEPQNIYDDPGFFAGYSTLERFGAGWERAAEHDDLLALLPDVDGQRVLDLGCGAGQLAHHLATAGAAEVVGVDVSERMLELARAGWAHPRVTYRREAIEEAAFPPARFDLIVSSLAFHYVDDYAGLIRRIAGWLAPGGVLVYSTEHPIFTARLPDGGWVLDGAGRPTGWAEGRRRRSAGVAASRAARLHCPVGRRGSPRRRRPPARGPRVPLPGRPRRGPIGCGPARPRTSRRPKAKKAQPRSMKTFFVSV